MTKYFKTTKSFGKPVISTILNTIAFEDYATLHLNGKKRLFVAEQSAIKHRNKSYEYQNNDKYRQKPKIHWKSARRKCRSLLVQKLFSESFIHDFLNVFCETMGSIHFKIKRKDSKRKQKCKKKLTKNLKKNVWKLVALKPIIEDKTISQNNFGCSANYLVLSLLRLT